MTAVVYGGLQDGSTLLVRIQGLGIRTIVWITPNADEAYQQNIDETVNNADCLIVKTPDDSSIFRKLMEAALTRRVPVFREECVDRIQCMHSF
ncbi:MAG: hypothetical protein FD164_2243 [Nitrospirae bacterium]|nr:MAG: hypothetical protein FD164_2243 [Nitrospirota bacterium]